MTTNSVSTAFARIEQMRYLTGIIAGTKLKEGTPRNSSCVVYPAAYRIPEVVRGINAFLLGCRSVLPSCEVKVMWISTW